MAEPTNVTIAAMIDELRVIMVTRGPMEIGMVPASVLTLASLLQLAKRHPGVTGSSREVADGFLGAAREYFTGYPTILAILDKGDDPACDVPTHI